MQTTDAQQPGGTLIGRDYYQIRVQGHLDQRWSEWFGGMTITHEVGGESVLSGPVVDQAALYGLLARVGSLGLKLVAVNLVKPESPPGQAQASTEIDR